MTTGFSATRLERLPQLVCACASLRRASRSVTHLYERAVRMRVPQFTLLYVLESQSDHTLVQGMIAELLSIDRTTLTRTLGTLQRRGWIRARASEDKRERLWSLTAAGKRQLELARPRWEHVQDMLRKRLGEQRWDPLLDLLTNVAAAARMRATDGIGRFRIRKTPAPRL